MSTASVFRGTELTLQVDQLDLTGGNAGGFGSHKEWRHLYVPAPYLITLSALASTSAESSGRSSTLETDYKLELRLLFHWEMGRLGAFQDLVYVTSGAAGVLVVVGGDVSRKADT